MRINQAYQDKEILKSELSEWCGRNPMKFPTILLLLLCILFQALPAIAQPQEVHPIWIGEPMPPHVWDAYIKHWQDMGPPDAPKHTLVLIDWKTRILFSPAWLKRKQYVHAFAGGHSIDRNSEYEDDLVRVALGGSPHEVGRLRAFLRDGRVIESSIVHGTHDSVSVFKTMPQRFGFLAYLKLIGVYDDVIEIESAHVHPVFEFLDVTTGTPFFLPLSWGDVLSSMKGAGLTRGILFTEKAILPGGYSYRISSVANNEGDDFSPIREVYWKQKGLELPKELKQSSSLSDRSDELKRRGIDLGGGKPSCTSLLEIL